MSDYGDYEEYAEGNDQYPDYQEQPMEVEQDYQTKVDLDYYEAEELLRKGKTAECITSLEQLYQISEEHNLRNWKVKILNLLLQIYCQQNNPQKIKLTLQKISELNKKEKYTENSIKSIILTIKSLPEESFSKNKEVVYGFLEQLDTIGKVRSYLLFLQKAVEDKNKKQSQALFYILDKLISQDQGIIPAGSLIELYSLQIRYARWSQKDIRHKIRRMQLKLATIQSEIYMSQGHISIIKQAIAQVMYQQDNYEECAMYICQSFQENMKYGKHSNLEQMLKINVLVTLLTNNQQLYTNDKFSGLYHQSASSFKTKSDVQALYGLIQAFINNDAVKFVEQAQVICLVDLPNTYRDIVQKALTKLKKNKALQIVKPYSKVKLSYMQRRLHCNDQGEVKDLIFDLIAGRQINGRLRIEDPKSGKESYLSIHHAKDEFTDGQLSNIRQLMSRYM